MRWFLAIALVVGAASAAAQRPDVLQVLPPPPRTAQTVEVMNADAPVFVGPRGGTKRRGTLARLSRLPFQRRVAGRGCGGGVWVQVGTDLYVCERHLRYSALGPQRFAQPQMTPGRLLPHDYAFVAVDGTRAFARPYDYFEGDYVEALGSGFGVILTGSQFYQGVPFVKTRRQLWIEADQLRPARGSDFAGVELTGVLDLGWVRRPNTPIYSQPGGRRVEQLGRRAVVRLSPDAAGARRRGWHLLQDGRWIRARDIVIASAAPRPEGVEADGTWIDVDVATQVLVAYRGDTPVYATLVSTGRAHASHATPLGVHRIWVKLAFSDMDNLERDDLHENYAIERVPWVQYFEGANGLHAAFWHDEFGRRRSHGCVNLSPRDARWLFDFTEPALPAGWTALFPLEDEPTTMIQVR